jgi:hypothetical protein
LLIIKHNFEIVGMFPKVCWEFPRKNCWNSL